MHAYWAHARVCVVMHGMCWHACVYAVPRYEMCGKVKVTVVQSFGRLSLDSGCWDGSEYVGGYFLVLTAC